MLLSASCYQGRDSDSLKHMRSVHVLFRTVSLLAALAAFCPASFSSAQNARIDLYADAAMSGCEIIDDGMAIRSIHVFFTGDELIGVCFAAPIPACWEGATYAGQTVPGKFLQAGDSQAGVMLALDDCYQPPAYLLAIHYFTTGTAPPCCEYTAQPRPPNPFFICDGFEYRDCGQVPATWEPGVRVVVNADDTCSCQHAHAVESTTWGRVKALYR
jgi:hypothetical protein